MPRSAGSSYRLPAGRAEPVGGSEDGTAVLAGAADPGRTHLCRAAVLFECHLERAQLSICVDGRFNLRLDEVRPLATAAASFEQQAADVAQLELAELAQVARPAPDSSALDERRWGRDLDRW
jgi:hypothetical protein